MGPSAVGERPGGCRNRDGITPFSSSTLARLYFRQGLVDQAVEVYRYPLEEAPGNDGHAPG